MLFGKNTLDDYDFTTSYKQTFFSNWSQENYESFQWYLLWQGGDILSTHFALQHDGAYEANSLVYSKHPDLQELLWKKSLFIVGTWYLLDTFATEKEKTIILKLTNIVQFAIDANNVRIGLSYKY
jgi:hypothetical protein